MAETEPWRIAAAWRATRRRAGEGWSCIPRAQRRRWLARLGVGLAAGVVLSGALTVGVRATTRLDAETAFLRWVQREWVLTADVAELVTILGGSMLLVPAIAALSLLLSYRRRTALALSVVASWLFPGILILVGWFLWDRPRPELLDGGAHNPALPSFPSGHTAHTVAVYGFLAWLWATSTPARGERVVAFGLAAVLCAAIVASRLRLAAHWPSDVLAGGILGLFWAAATAWATRAVHPPLAAPRPGG